MSNENESFFDKSSTVISILLQAIAAVFIIYISYLVHETDAAYKAKQEAISLVDRSQKMDTILSEMYAIVATIEKSLAKGSLLEGLISIKQNMLFSSSTNRETRSKLFDVGKGNEVKLVEIYQEISYNIELLRMKYGIYFPVLLQQFGGASSLIMTAPTKEYEEWLRFNIKMMNDGINYSFLDLCINGVEREAVVASSLSIEHCKKYKVESLNLMIGNHIPIFSTLKKIIRVNGSLLQDYADGMDREIPK